MFIFDIGRVLHNQRYMGLYRASSMLQVYLYVGIKCLDLNEIANLRTIFFITVTRFQKLVEQLQMMRQVVNAFPLVVGRYGAASKLLNFFPSSLYFIPNFVSLILFFSSSNTYLIEMWSLLTCTLTEPRMYT